MSLFPGCSIAYLSLGPLEVCALAPVVATKADETVDYAELNAPPMINYGVVYPQGILIFVITLLYSVIQPLIVIFGAIYFGTAYVVYKYKLLFGGLHHMSFMSMHLTT